ncbi:MAG TPA: hypothetical protein VFT36_07230 [Methylomirabilota bacterium]|nr:hypothetical protein [Methylomirabilota bacterium]
MAEASTLVVLGMMGRMPVAGVTWQALQYLEGFRRLGFDVHYVEDTGEWSYDPDRNTISDDPSYAVGSIGALMARHGLSGRWAYRAPDGRVFGLTASALERLFERTDALVNLTGATVLREEHRRVPVRVYLETDPVLPQIEVARGDAFHVEMLSAHTHHFTYGENLGQPDCGVPVGRFAYRPTRPPVVLDWWEPAADAPGPCFTTVASWRQAGKDVEWQGQTYTWSKHHEFLKLIDLPRRTAQPLELALAIRGRAGDGESGWIPRDREDADALRLLTRHGWRVVNALPLSHDLAAYRAYLLGSRGEFTVAKDQNVRLRSGWFSDRSACYLAAGRPVVTQDTAFGKFVPTGEGLFAFAGADDAVAALAAINADYTRHARAAREIARDYFQAETVLGKLAQDAGLAGCR